MHEVCIHVIVHYLFTYLFVIDFEMWEIWNGYREMEFQFMQLSHRKWRSKETCTWKLPVRWRDKQLSRLDFKDYRDASGSQKAGSGVSTWVSILSDGGIRQWWEGSEVVTGHISQTLSPLTEDDRLQRSGFWKFYTLEAEKLVPYYFQNEKVVFKNISDTSTCEPWCVQKRNVECKRYSHNYYITNNLKYS